MLGEPMPTFNLRLDNLFKDAFFFHPGLHIFVHTYACCHSPSCIDPISLCWLAYLAFGVPGVYLKTILDPWKQA